MARAIASAALAVALIAMLFWVDGRADPSEVAAAVQASTAPASARELDSYRTALATLERPVNMEFEYTVTRSGPNRIVTELHRVYWTSAGQERNDTIAVNGTPIVPARSRMLRRSTWPYDVGQFAVSADDYDATPTGLAVVAGQKVYGFALARKAPADFSLKSLYVDAKRHLPVRETFDVAGSNCAGNGSISFAAAGTYWLPNFISVACSTTAQGASLRAIFKESIRFSSYHFPAAIPGDVFGAASPTPDEAAPVSP